MPDYENDHYKNLYGNSEAHRAKRNQQILNHQLYGAPLPKEQYMMNWVTKERPYHTVQNNWLTFIALYVIIGSIINFKYGLLVTIGIVVVKMLIRERRTNR